SDVCSSDLLAGTLTDFPDDVELAHGEVTYVRLESGELTHSETAYDAIRKAPLQNRPVSYPGDNEITIQRPTRTLYLTAGEASIKRYGLRPPVAYQYTQFPADVAVDLVKRHDFAAPVKTTAVVNLCRWDPRVYPGKLYR